jgi:hypothetical protein
MFSLKVRAEIPVSPVVPAVKLEKLQAKGRRQRVLSIRLRFGGELNWLHKNPACARFLQHSSNAMIM